MTVCPRDTLLHSRPKLSFLLLAKQEFRHLPEKCQGSPFLLYIPPDGFPTRNQRNVCAAARSALQDTGEARADKRRPARAVSSRSFGTPKQRGISRHVPDRHDVSPSFADLPTVSFHSGPAVAGANGDTSGSMTGRDPARRNSCLSWNRKSPLCVCPGRPLSDPPGRTLILPLLHTFYTHPVFPLISSPECFFLLAMPSGFVGRKGLSSCLNFPD